MLSPVMMMTIGSVFLGFFLFTGAFASYSYKKPQALTWTLFGECPIVCVRGGLGLQVVRESVGVSHG
ncbi:hypothetical protein CIP107563_02205 [Corynebacterium diphtheriae]|nr:hypothetical protein CIP107563_02205 [Corynebacterium diphtheriae]